MTNKPKVRPKLVFREEGDEAFIFDADNGTIKLLNDSGILIWKLCDGEHDRESIIDAIMEEFDASSRESVNKDLDYFIEQLAQYDMLETEGE